MTDTARRRLAVQGVSGPGASSIEGAVTHLLAIQAQDFHAAKFAVALRSTGSEVDVDDALADGRIVRSWPMRGTLLFLARDDARWVTELLAPRSFAASRGVWRNAGLVEDDFVRAADIARDLLSGQQLSRAELLAAFDAGGVTTGGGRGAHLIRRIAGEATIVFAAPRGTEQTFALLDEWVPDARRLDRDSALAELAARYVTGHGPVTPHDLAWWSGLTVADSRKAIALAGDAIETDAEGFLVASDPAPSLPSRGDVRLLPAFDELLLGYADRTSALPAHRMAQVVPYSNGLFSPTLMIDGTAAGIWRRTLPKGTRQGSGVVDIQVEPFESVSARVASLIERRAAEYAAYLGAVARLTVLPPTPPAAPGRP